MKINYTVNHNFYNLPLFEGMKNQDRVCTFIMLNCIVNFYKTVGYCDFYKKQMSEDWAITIKAFTRAEKFLIDSDYIKVIKAYSAKAKTPARYIITKKLKKDLQVYGSVSQKQWSRGPKTVVQGTTINDIKSFKIGESLSNDALPNKKGDLPETKTNKVVIKTNNNDTFLQ